MLVEKICQGSHINPLSRFFSVGDGLARIIPQCPCGNRTLIGNLCAVEEIQCLANNGQAFLLTDFPIIQLPKECTAKASAYLGSLLVHGAFLVVTRAGELEAGSVYIYDVQAQLAGASQFVRLQNGYWMEDALTAEATAETEPGRRFPDGIGPDEII